MGTFLRKLIPNNIAALIGVVQVVIPLLKEVVVAVIRIIDVFTPDKGLEPLIVGVTKMADDMTARINTFKNMFLGG